MWYYGLWGEVHVLSATREIDGETFIQLMSEVCKLKAGSSSSLGPSNTFRPNGLFCLLSSVDRFWLVIERAVPQKKHVVIFALRHHVRRALWSGDKAIRPCKV